MVYLLKNVIFHGYDPPTTEPSDLFDYRNGADPKVSEMWPGDISFWFTEWLRYTLLYYDILYKYRQYDYGNTIIEILRKNIKHLLTI